MNDAKTTQESIAMTHTPEQIKQVSAEYMAGLGSLGCGKSRPLTALEGELVQALEECASDLGSEIKYRYQHIHLPHCPSEQRRHDSEMQPVTRARTLISKAKAQSNVQ